MIKEIYSRDVDAPKYNDDVIEVTDELQQLILKIEEFIRVNYGNESTEYIVALKEYALLLFNESEYD